MFLIRVSKIGRYSSICKEISRCLGTNKPVIKNGPSLKEFLKSLPSQAAESADPCAEIESRIFLDNVKRLNEQAEESGNSGTIAKKAVYFEIYGCQMNVNDTEVAYSILLQTG